MKSLENKTAIITGAGSGMGKAMAKLFAAEGARVFATDISGQRLELLLKEITEEGGTVAVLKTNVADEQEVESMVKTAVQRFGSVDVLVNNAGVMDDFMPVGETSTELWSRVMGININGPFYATRAVVKLMLERKSGVIINIASIGGFSGGRAGAAYTTSKHALIGLTRNTGFMYATNGIRCVAIAPGAVSTAIGEGMKPNPMGYGKLSLGLQSNPRQAEPVEIAELALFLASGKASFVNGCVITADGGWTAY